MQVRHELPTDEKIPLRIAVRYALYGVVLTEQLGEPVDRGEYRLRARPTSALYGLDEAAGYKKRCLLLQKLLEEARDQTLQLNGYTSDLGGKLEYSWSHHRSFRSDCVINEEDNEIFEISEKYIKYINKDIMYYECNIPYEMKDRYRHWTKITVERARFLGFMERLGLIGEDMTGAGARSDGIILRLQERSGEAERYFTEIENPIHRRGPIPTGQESPAAAKIGTSGAANQSTQRKSVQRALSATIQKLKELHPTGAPLHMSIKQFRSELETAETPVSEATVRRALVDLGWRIPITRPRR
jgi:hypothetical protein